GHSILLLVGFSCSDRRGGRDSSGKTTARRPGAGRWPGRHLSRSRGISSARMGDTGIAIRWATGPQDLRGALAVREQVFCREQGVPRSEELDGRDGDALHLVALQAGGERVIGTLRLLFAGSTAKIGRVAVERAERRR